MVRRPFLAVAGAFLAAGLSGAVIGDATADDRSARLRVRELTTVEGQPTTLAAWDGEILVVNFWASWCAPCRTELATLDEWNAEWVTRGARVVAVSIDSDRARALRFAADQELDLTVLHDGPDGLARELDLPAVPTTYVLDREGEVVLEVQGSGERELKRMRQAVEQLLAVRNERAGL
ncbi:MAG: TlpA family protein disulfide reductase [bacterium]|nr:TlpA family protein disulfide reductase [bacterium]